MFHATMHETPAGRPALSRQIWLPKKPVMRRYTVTHEKKRFVRSLSPLDILGPRASKEERRDQSSSSRTSHLAAVGTNRPLFFPLLLGNCPHGLRRRNGEGEEEEEQKQRYLECCRRNPLPTSSQTKKKKSALKEGSVRPLKTATNRRVASESPVHFSQHKYSIFARRTRLHGKDLLQDVSSFFVVAKRGHILYDIKPDRYCMHPTVFLIVPAK